MNEHNLIGALVGIVLALPFGVILGYLLLCAEARLRKAKTK